MQLSESDITVRKINFSVPSMEEFNPIYMLDNPTISYRFTAIGLFVALLEPAIVKAVRKVVPLITNASLKTEVEKFCHQEAHHYAQHKRFNKLILAQGYPGLDECVSELQKDFDRFLTEKPEKFMIGYIEGFESFTTQSALEAISSGMFDHPKNSKKFSDLFKWHMVEEIEHRTVAFDLYNHLYGDYFFRAKMCWFAQKHQESFLSRCSELMSQHDVATKGVGHQLDPKVVKFLKTKKLKKSLKSMLPTYSPHKYKVPPTIKALSQEYDAHKDLIPIVDRG